MRIFYEIADDNDIEEVLYIPLLLDSQDGIVKNACNDNADPV